MAPQCQLVLLFTGDAILAGHKLGGQAHDVRFATELLLGAVQRIRDEVGAHVQSADEGVDALTILQPGGGEKGGCEGTKEWKEGRKGRGGEGGIQGLRGCIRDAAVVNAMSTKNNSHGERTPALQGGGGGQGCQGTIPTGIISEGENFATSRSPEACCYFLVGSGWFLSFPGGHFQNLRQHGIPMHSSHTTTARCK